MSDQVFILVGQKEMWSDIYHYFLLFDKKKRHVQT